MPSLTVGLLTLLLTASFVPAQTNNLQARLENAATLIRENRIAEAEQQLNTILKTTPNEAAALNLLGTIRAQQGKLNEAESLLTRAAKMHGVRQETIKKHFPSALKKEKGRFRAAKSDRYRATLYVPGADGQPVPVQTRGSRERRQLSNYLRDVGRYMRGNRNALSAWRGKKIAGVELVTDGRTLQSIEPALSDFSLYRMFNGGAD